MERHFKTKCKFDSKNYFDPKSEIKGNFEPTTISPELRVAWWASDGTSTQENVRISADL